MKRVLILIAVAVLLHASQAIAGELVVGSVHLSLGMPEQDTIARLSKEFSPKLVNEHEGKYLLWKRNESGMPQSVGSVSFKSGQLYRASKTWADEFGDSSESLEALFRLLAQVAGSDGRAGKIKAQTLVASPRGQDSGSEVRVITLEMPPDRRVTVRFYKDLPAPGNSEALPSIEVREELVDLR